MNYKIVLAIISSSLINDIFGIKHVQRNSGKIFHRIVGGFNISIRHVPYQAYLLMENEISRCHGCGGSIISKHFILTAAHCLLGIKTITARVGSIEAMSAGTVYETSHYKKHPLYKPATSDCDIGLIYFPNGMVLDGLRTKALQLPTKDVEVTSGTDILVTGWGLTSEKGYTSKYLMAIKVPVVSQVECQKSYTALTSRQFCAGVTEGGKDSCQGDSGGPAVSLKTGLQLGVVSFGMGCARSGYPGVYTSIPKLRAWIKYSTRI